MEDFEEWPLNAPNRIKTRILFLEKKKKKKKKFGTEPELL